MKTLFPLVALALLAAHCQRAEPMREPHQNMLPPGAPPMPHADHPMAMADGGSGMHDAAPTQPPAPARN